MTRRYRQCDHQGKGLTFAQSHENDHPNDSQIEGDFEFQRDEIERRLGHGRSLQDTRVEIVWNGILQAVRVVGGRTAFADQIGTARPLVRVLLGDE